MDQAKRYVIEKKLPVMFAGFLNQTEIARAYVAADCLVLPSDYGETWGLVVNEGMVCGLPAIVSDRVGCGLDLVKDGITGYVFPFGDIKALANKLIEMASHADKRITMGDNAQKLIQEYSVEKAVEGTLQAIKFVWKQTG
jgi:glycosyltransferase involved in cell wall biosynthesis